MPKLPQMQQLATNPVLSKHFPASRLARINKALQIHATSDLGNSPLANQRRFRQEGNLAIRLLTTKEQFNERISQAFPSCFIQFASENDLFVKRKTNGKNLELGAQILNHNLPSEEILTSARKTLSAFNKYFKLAKDGFISNLKINP